MRVGDADALVLAEVTAADPEDLGAAVAAFSLETTDEGAVRMSVGTEDGLIFVGATMMPPTGVEAVAVPESSELELETAAYSPVLRTV